MVSTTFTAEFLVMVSSSIYINLNHGRGNFHIKLGFIYSITIQELESNDYGPNWNRRKVNRKQNRN